MFTGRMIITGGHDGLIAISSRTTGMTVRVLNDHRGAPVTGIDVQSTATHVSARWDLSFLIRHQPLLLSTDWQVLWYCGVTAVVRSGLCFGTNNIIVTVFLLYFFTSILVVPILCEVMIMSTWLNGSSSTELNEMAVWLVSLTSSNLQYLVSVDIHFNCHGCTKMVYISWNS